MIDLQFYEDMHAVGTRLSKAMEGEHNRLKKKVFRQQWCVVNEAFKVLSGMTLYEANRIFLKDDPDV